MHRVWRLGIETGWIEKTTEAQDGKCALCKKVPDELVVDHCHRTNRLRAMLCRKCNWMLALCGDDVGLLQDAICYVQREWPNCLAIVRDRSSGKVVQGQYVRKPRKKRRSALELKQLRQE